MHNKKSQRESSNSQFIASGIRSDHREEGIGVGKVTLCTNDTAGLVSRGRWFAMRDDAVGTGGALPDLFTRLWL